ncbi:dnaJ-like protein 60 [Drosophila ficusphila]|uniref:dnaJ-like protein 60 n=1 Tax=Drosophila ficusphila TaxID=30025 RepID=UPI001C8AEF31|nr:dnaJ-like protein 60 [Drosophila ficusphila]
MLRLCLSPRTAGGSYMRNFSHEKQKKAETHYEVLNVRRDCTSREVRDAFVQLSKLYHPDAKSNAVCPERTARFVQISEAYKTLIKPQKRRDYDDSLLWQPSRSDRSPVGDTGNPGQPWDVKPNYDPNPGPYYGIRGLKRVSNWQVALVLMALGVLGAVFGFTSVRTSFRLNRQSQDEISAEANSHHAAVVADAQKYGNEEQVRRMVDRMSRSPFNQTSAK